MRYKLGLVALVCCVSHALGTAALALPAGYTWEAYGGHWYALSSDFGTWQECEDEAVVIGAHLVNINDAQEDLWLAEAFKDTNTRGPTDNNIAWIGLRGFVSNNSLYWICGDPVNYTNITTVRPFDGEYWYLHGNNHPDGGWNSNSVHNTEYDQNPKGIIEIPEPATLALLLIGGLTLLRRRRK